ncbi:uncharacterized protein [Aegilops tauschii subsp. strangulata]|uniref:uncharacterized protein n=1 Tax=Aegilops tauschii subsp. strangulata TaxID=200361 RepID=UPI000989E577|nr:uncharacterized protein LOC109771195 [Aegilops tauschii subsp. strangulata]
MNSDMEYIYERYVESSDSSNGEDYTDEMAMMHAMLADAEHAEEHVLNFKGSIKGHRVLGRNRARSHLTLMDDYFTLDVLFVDNFPWRFQMHKNVFDCLYHIVRSFDDYFILKKDVVGRIGFSGYQKCMAALQMLAYGTTVDSWDEYLWMSESTCGDALVRFATIVVEVFGPHYLREQTVTDIESLLGISEARRWSSLIVLLDCMNWKWKTAQKLFKGNIRVMLRNPCTIILEAVASQDLWISHAFFGICASHNDINVLQRSPLFARLMKEKLLLATLLSMGMSTTLTTI